MSLSIEDDIRELPDRETWEAPQRLSLQEARDQIGGAHDKNPRGRWNAGEEEDQ